MAKAATPLCHARLLLSHKLLLSTVGTPVVVACLANPLCIEQLLRHPSLPLQSFTVHFDLPAKPRHQSHHSLVPCMSVCCRFVSRLQERLLLTNSRPKPYVGVWACGSAATVLLLSHVHCCCFPCCKPVLWSPSRDWRVIAWTHGRPGQCQHAEPSRNCSSNCQSESLELAFLHSLLHGPHPGL